MTHDSDMAADGSADAALAPAAAVLVLWRVLATRAVCTAAELGAEHTLVESTESASQCAAMGSTEGGGEEEDGDVAITLTRPVRVLVAGSV